MVILVLFVCVAVAIAIYILYKREYNKKHRPWATKEAHDRYLKEVEKEMQEKFEKDLEEYKKAYAPHASKDISNAYSSIAETFISNILSPDEYLNILTAIKNENHVKLHLSELDRKQMGDITHLYVKEYTRDTSGSDIFQYLTVEDSEMGVWQAYLLYNISPLLPTWWHANTIATKYIFAYKDIKITEVLNSLSDYSKSLAPNVEKLAKGYYHISYCYWSDWLGLIKKNVEVILSDGKPTFNFLDYEVLCKYSCGINF